MCLVFRLVMTYSAVLVHHEGVVVDLCTFGKAGHVQCNSLGVVRDISDILEEGERERERE